MNTSRPPFRQPSSFFAARLTKAAEAGGWVAAPLKLVSDATLPPLALHVFLTLCHHGPDGESDLSISAIADAIGRSRSAVRAALNALIEKGLVVLAENRSWNFTPAIHARKAHTRGARARSIDHANDSTARGLDDDGGGEKRSGRWRKTTTSNAAHLTPKEEPRKTPTPTHNGMSALCGGAQPATTPETIALGKAYLATILARLTRSATQGGSDAVFAS